MLARSLVVSGAIRRAPNGPLRSGASLSQWALGYSAVAPVPLVAQRRHQSQSYHNQQVAFVEGEVTDGFRGGAQNKRRLDPDNIPHFVKCAIQNDRREFGLPEVDDWRSFAEEAVYLPSRSGTVWVGPDDPRCVKLVRRREKLKERPNQINRKMTKKDPVAELEQHPLRRYFTTSTNLSDPLSIATGLHQAGMIKSTDLRFTASKLEYKPRPPIVTIMGHVDHGKTTLLDYLRRTNVAQGEAGGITQTIGAFKVKVGDETVTFVDTPGHAAFNSMREAGAAITDIIIVVISAVDGIQPQTEEVLAIARSSNVPIVIAVNKIDRRPDIEHIRSRLRELDVELEEDGGDVQLVKISALDGTGIPELLDAIRLQAELCEIMTPVPSRTEILIIESKHGAKTNEVTGIVRCGQLRPNMTFVSGVTFGTIKQFTDEHRQPLGTAGVGDPITFTGFTMLPKPGNVLLQVSGEDHAKNFHLFMKEAYKVEGGREQFLQTLSRESSGEFFNRKPDNNNVRAFDDKPFNLVCKAETFGMLQALLRMVYELPKLPGIALQVKITEVGGLRDADIAIAGGTNQPGAFLVFGKCRDDYFMSIPSYMHEIRFDVLYHGIETLKEKMVGTLPLLKKVRELSTAVCQQTFRASQAGRGNAAGVLVTSGSFLADCPTVQVLRKVNRDDEEPEVVHEGPLRELRRFKDVVPSVEAGMECGVILHDDFVFQVGDRIVQVEHYTEERDVATEFDAALEIERRMRLQEMHEQRTNPDAALAKEEESAAEATK